MRLLLILILSISSVVCSAQNPITEVKFEHYSYDFGEINEVDGDVSHTFKYTNVGKNPFVIYSISTSCGCTSPSYSKKPIELNGSSELTIVFDPTNQPGRNEKRIIVSCNVGSGAVELHIKAIVKPRPRTIEDDFPIVFSDGIRLADMVINGYTLSNNKDAAFTMELINNSTKQASITIINDSLPDWLSAFVAQPFINGGQKTKLVVNVRPAGKNLWGKKIVNIRVKVNDKLQFVDVIFNTTFIEDFSKISDDEFKNAPKITLSGGFYHFSKVHIGEVAKHSFKIKNNGANELIIRYIDTPSKIKVQSNSLVLKRGEEAIITIEIDTTLPDALAETIRFITNDPSKPVAEFRVMANIE